MKILLIEDDENKIKQIQEFLVSEYGEKNIEVRKSYQSGLKTILNEYFDFVLLDMSMPVFDKSLNETGGEFMKFAGEDIIKEMDRNDRIYKTIIVTQYEDFGEKTLTDIKNFMRENFKHIYIGTVFYSASETNWKSELEKF